MRAAAIALSAAGLIAVGCAGLRRYSGHGGTQGVLRFGARPPLNCAAYATDPLALRLLQAAIAVGLDRPLSARQFLYMPFQHTVLGSARICLRKLKKALRWSAERPRFCRHARGIWCRLTLP
jgi:hypothetical protein